MGTIQEAGKKTDVGVREIAEAPELEAALRHGELELKEEWQDEEFPRLLPEEVDPSEDPGDPKGDSQAGTPSTLALCGQRPMRKRLSAPELRLSLTKGPGNDGASPTQSTPSSPDGSSDLEVDELEIPSDSEQLDSGHEFEWEGGKQTRGLKLKDQDGLNGIAVRTNKVGPRAAASKISFLKWNIVSRGGGDSIPNYTYVMEHLFRYMVGTLELLVAENYLLVHLSGGTSRAQVPPLSWIRQCYRTLDRRLRKNLRALVVVHATWYVKAFLALLRPFISSKFTRKIRFLDSLGELAQLISLDQVHIPEAVRQLDRDLHGSGGT
uniref:Bcl-2/adenovirus E1B 19 kDa-interacting protein 2-like protein n=1 Tax=Macaca nemestrina TaxID=9545 RepID=A0A2K6CV42_MACNE